MEQRRRHCHLELTQGCRYGLIGENGSGKSNVLAAIAQRDKGNVPSGFTIKLRKCDRAARNFIIFLSA